MLPNYYCIAFEVWLTTVGSLDVTLLLAVARAMPESIFNCFNNSFEVNYAYFSYFLLCIMLVSKFTHFISGLYKPYHTHNNMQLQYAVYS